MKEISILSWNVQGIGLNLRPTKFNVTGYTSFRKIEPELVKFKGDIIALQEMCEARKYIADNPAFAEYNIYTPKNNGLEHNRTKNYNYNVLLSKFPIMGVKEITLNKGKKAIPSEKVTRAEIQIGKKTLRIYIAHFPVKRGSMGIRLNYLESLFNDAIDHKGPVIICGDLNTTIPETGWKRGLVKLLHLQPKNMAEVNGEWIHSAEQKVIARTVQQNGFIEALNPRTPTWAPMKSTVLKSFHLKLDWFIVKGLRVNKIKLGKYISDHRSVRVDCSI